MLIKKADFIISNTDVNKCPEPNKPEYAFIGRSNVGKSSLINMLVNKKNLAKTSGKPGKTQVINHFLINENWYIVDLPGYGYASVSKQKRTDFAQIIKQYLTKRKNLMSVFVLIDSRLTPQKIDIEFMAWLGELRIPFVICFTKQDKLSKSESEINLMNYKKEMLKYWEYLPQFFKTSSSKNRGKNEILEFIYATNKLF
tara:strand:- start:2348 stop:2944 length:597 start_codon:yes stop_codon:yes gene_type:complete